MQYVVVLKKTKFLNEAKTKLNVVIGFCIGHDFLFFKYLDISVLSNNFKRKNRGEILEEEIKYLYDDLVKKTQIFE